ncbi:hypothetical protein E3N88_35709 [Mikania micrantha]|uniref:PSI subunit V n=1 Tax=Mikania micrantha TaxID=192012 RepID=A0A5N6M1P7_9ASTR|nr:hypothetical protein E3N88_35709 [Mikania micrantha]
MATAASTMASQLKSSLATSFTRGLVTPKGISGKQFRVLPSFGKSTFTIKAVQSDKPINGDPFIGSLETPVTSSPLIAWYLSNLPGYRTAVNPLLREYAGAAGSLAAGGLVVILSICLTMYGIASFKEGEPSIAPSLTLTGRKKEPDQLQTADGWAKFSGGSSLVASQESFGLIIFFIAGPSGKHILDLLPLMIICVALFASPDYGGSDTESSDGGDGDEA